MIRKAVAADASRLGEILIFAKRTTYRPIFQNDEASFNEMQVLDLALTYRDAPETLKNVYVYDDGIVRGMMSWGISPVRWELKELYVDPFFQGQHIGRALLTHFIDSAREQHIPRLTLWVLEKNTPARGFYEKFGFSQNGGKKLEENTEEFCLEYELVL